jgi:hypothetical protein
VWATRLASLRRFRSDQVTRGMISIPHCSLSAMGHLHAKTIEVHRQRVARKDTRSQTSCASQKEDDVTDHSISASKATHRAPPGREMITSCTSSKSVDDVSQSALTTEGSSDSITFRGRVIFAKYCFRWRNPHHDHITPFGR